ncbi:phage integrase N-terminal SAM-like domain-containing protein [Vibrio sp. 10N.261.51.A4]|uniref:phage integrase N-terminal SAM-like domain-containing protein n=1 Tax=Vibrio sp. 10N.261.51.A4 TaxID=3229674 RepID=UPI00354E5FC3
MNYATKPYQTEKSYLYWNRYFIRHCNIRHGADISPALIEQFLCFLAVECEVSHSYHPGVIGTL